MNVAAHFESLARRRSCSAGLYFKDETYSWSDLGRTALDVADAIQRTGLPIGGKISWIARNTPEGVAGAFGIFVSGRCISPLNGNAPEPQLLNDLQRLDHSMLVCGENDWTPALAENVRNRGATSIVISLKGEIRVRELGTPPSTKRRRAPVPVSSLVLERMSSGTTGEPKRIEVDETAFIQAMKSALGRTSFDEHEERRSPAVLVFPFAHSAGIWALAMTLFEGRPIVLLERFQAVEWAQAIARFKPRVAQLVPTMIEMLLASSVERADLASLICVRSGTAPLHPESKLAFEERFGCPILQDYGATEFMGGVAGWTLADHRLFGGSKPSAVGRVRADVEVRILSPETDEELPRGEIGILALKSVRFGSDWVRTTDLASLDEDRFLFIHGRSDEAIIRGGFKILPEKVADILRLHAAVKDACVLGYKDDRLGELPLAVIEPEEGVVPTAAELTAFARLHMPAYQVPASFEFIEALPRTLSLKVERPVLKHLFSNRYIF